MGTICKDLDKEKPVNFNLCEEDEFSMLGENLGLVTLSNDCGQ